MELGRKRQCVEQRPVRVSKEKRRNYDLRQPARRAFRRSGQEGLVAHCLAVEGWEQALEVVRAGGWALVLTLTRGWAPEAARAREGRSVRSGPKSLDRGKGPGA
jgi:hypothetical protein